MALTLWFASYDGNGDPDALYRLDAVTGVGLRLDADTGDWIPSDTPGAVHVEGSDRAIQIPPIEAERIARETFGRDLAAAAPTDNQPVIFSRPPDDPAARDEWIDSTLDGLGAP